MDYEKKYNEALDWMRELYPGLHGATKEDAEHYFPELKENEDERTRKELIELISCMHDADPRKKRWIAYLEKQKEPDGTWTEEDDAKVKVMCEEGELTPSERAWLKKLKNRIVKKEQKESGIKWLKSDNLKNPDKPYIDKAGMFYTTDGRMCYASEIEKQKEQKPVEWSEEDINIINVLECIVGNHCPDEIFKIGNKQGVSAYKICSWLKSLRDKGNFSTNNTNSKSAWSEEDEGYYNAFMCEVVKEKMNPTIEQVKWLRGIRDRLKSLQPQPKQEQNEQKPEVKLTGWVARDGDERIWVYETCPKKHSEWLEWVGNEGGSMCLDQKSFPNLKWEDEPVEVEIIIRKK